MNLKKINPNLQKALQDRDFEEANELQSDTWSAIKSGADCVVIAPKQSGKTTAIALNIIQKLGKPEGESTRALVLVETKEAVLELTTLFEELAQYTGLRIFGVHERGDEDYDKNHISLGIDILIGTPAKVNSLFSNAGFNLNTVRIFAVDDADVLFKSRQDSVVLRLIESAVKTQILFFAQTATERVEIMADKLMVEPLFFEADDEEAEADEEDEELKEEE